MAYFQLPPPRHDYDGALGGFMFSNGVCSVPDDHEAYTGAKRMLCTYYAAIEHHVYPKKEEPENEEQQSGDSSPSAEGSAEVPSNDEQTDGEASPSSEGDEDGAGNGLRSDASDESGNVDPSPTEKPVVIDLTDRQTSMVYKAIDTLDPTNVLHWHSPGVPSADFLFRLTTIQLSNEQLAHMVKTRGKPDKKRPGRKKNPKKTS